MDRNPGIILASIFRGLNEPEYSLLVINPMQQ
uniref:Uncharacterized protein n=1 Tax=Utricularia reniformis TaxID=192314 RepID=A0A1Y0B1P1_9LAMI|nr:hypothetical protein AEK19_MT1153 [Utricularia reniformis]ART31366.1 hypothetical protein AEK19_MT1153 [Utricularia reniformis]